MLKCIEKSLRGLIKIVPGFSGSQKINTIWAKIREQLCFSQYAEHQNLTLSSQINEYVGDQDYHTLPHRAKESEKGLG